MKYYEQHQNRGINLTNEYFWKQNLFEFKTILVKNNYLKSQLKKSCTDNPQSKNRKNTTTKRERSQQTALYTKMPYEQVCLSKKCCELPNIDNII